MPPNDSTPTDRPLDDLDLSSVVLGDGPAVGFETPTYTCTGDPE